MRFAILILSFALMGGGLPVLDPYIGVMPTGTVRGRITNANGNPIAYANAILVGTTMGNMTLADGRFTIASVPAGAYTLRAMMMGFKAVEKSVMVAACPGASYASWFTSEPRACTDSPTPYVGWRRPPVAIISTSCETCSRARCASTQLVRLSLRNSRMRALACFVRSPSLTRL